VHHLRLTHPDLDFWIDVRVREFDGRWLAVADLADQPEVGVGWTVEEALEDAFAVFEQRRAAALTRSAVRKLGSG
jgi:hypothetical protein